MNLGTKMDLGLSGNKGCPNATANNMLANSDGQNNCHPPFESILGQFQIIVMLVSPLYPSNGWLYTLLSLCILCLLISWLYHHRTPAYSHDYSIDIIQWFCPKILSTSRDSFRVPEGKLISMWKTYGFRRKSSRRLMFHIQIWIDVYPSLGPRVKHTLTQAIKPLGVKTLKPTV